MSDDRFNLPAFAYELYPGDLVDDRRVTGVEHHADGETVTVTFDGHPDQPYPRTQILDIRRRVADIEAAAPRPAL